MTSMDSLLDFNKHEMTDSDRTPGEELQPWCGTRLCVLLTGFCVGILTFFPNMMMSDSGTDAAYRQATIGAIASICFIIGGIVGAANCFPSKSPWYCLLPAVVLQILALFGFLIVFLTLASVVGAFFMWQNRQRQDASTISGQDSGSPPPAQASFTSYSPIL